MRATLTGNITKKKKKKKPTFPEGAWRGTYFVPENLIQSAERRDQFETLVPKWNDMAENGFTDIYNYHNRPVSYHYPGNDARKNVL